MFANDKAGFMLAARSTDAPGSAEVMRARSGKHTMVRHAFFAASILLSFTTSPVLAQATSADAAGLSEGVAAVVNDKVISTFDVRQRTMFILATTGIEANQEGIQRATAQAIRALVDEQVQLQEMDKFKVQVGTEEVDRAIDNLARQNGGDRAQLTREMAAAGVSINTFRDQIRAELGWQRLVGGRYGQRIRVSPERVSETLARVTAGASKPQYLVSEIFLEVESPDQQDVVYQGALRLLEQIKQGSPFPSVARQFSAAASAASGGDIGWVGSGEIKSELEPIVATLAPGQVSTPIPVQGGFYIVALRDRREGATPTQRVTLREITIPLGSGASDAEFARAEQRLTNIRGAIRNCDGLDALARRADAVALDLGELGEDEFNDTYRAQSTPLQSGQTSPAFRTPTAASVLVMCERTADGAGLPSRGDVEERLYDQELGVLARRYLRDLRREASIITR